jgi:hypothetical protein
VTGFGAGAEDLKHRASIVTKQAFRHLASSGVSGTKDQNSHGLAPIAII